MSVNTWPVFLSLSIIVKYSYKIEKSPGVLQSVDFQILIRPLSIWYDEKLTDE